MPWHVMGPSLLDGVDAADAQWWTTSTSSIMSREIDSISPSCPPVCYYPNSGQFLSVWFVIIFYIHHFLIKKKKKKTWPAGHCPARVTRKTYGPRQACWPAGRTLPTPEFQIIFYLIYLLVTCCIMILDGKIVINWFVSN